MTKRILSVVLVLCLLLSCLPVGALAVTEEELYLQILDLGLVDADGSLIADNHVVQETLKLLVLRQSR